MAELIPIANLRGTEGEMGPQGLPGVNAVPADTAVAGYLSTTGASETQTAADARYARVLPMGGVGDGTADDTAAIQGTLDTAGSAFGVPVLVLGQPGAVYKVSRLRLRSRVILDLQGATLKGSSGAVSALVESPAMSDTGHIEGAGIINGTIDANNVTYGGVWLVDATRITVAGLRVINLKPAASTGIRVGENTTDCTIADNTVEMVLDEPFGTVASSVGISCTSLVADDQSGGQNNTLTFVEPTNLSTGHTIRNNRIVNGTHGIALVGAARIQVINNSTTGQGHRGIILSPRVVDTVISGNTVRDFISTGIHLAWGCERITITGNNVMSTRSAGEGDGIKGYFGCKNIVVTGNVVSGVTNGGIRFAVGSDKFTITGNRLIGNKVGILVQASMGAPYYIPATGGAVNGGTVTGNMISAAGVVSGAGIRLEQVNSDAVNRILISGNELIDIANGLVIAETTSNRVALIDMYGNSITASTDFTSPRGLGHFREAIGNGPNIGNKYASPLTGTPVAATDPATTMALVNNLRSKLITLGLIS